ncbi:hypothetical protein TYRP_012044 [Tyrophagus putrescentiae]|nr:hypothetical protein TYRP_012044 [Tyrophagus putrescentiae]
MSARSVLYYLKKTIFSLLVLSNLVGCIGFALLASYINNNFNAVYYAGKTKPIDTTTEAFIIAVSVVGALFHLVGLIASHREHILIIKVYGFLCLLGLIYAVVRAATAPVYLAGLIWYCTTGFCLLTVLATVWFVLDLEVAKRKDGVKYQAFLR